MEYMILVKLIGWRRNFGHQNIQISNQRQMHLIIDLLTEHLYFYNEKKTTYKF